jgi:hypothetical protein
LYGIGPGQGQAESACPFVFMAPEIVPQIIKRWLNLVTLKNSHSLYCSNYIADRPSLLSMCFLLSFMQTLPSPFLSTIRCMSLSLSSFVFSRMLQIYSSVSEHSYRNSQFHVLTHILFLFICEIVTVE